MEYRPRVLVVDDDQLIAQTFGTVLNVSGFDATVVYSGQAALAKAVEQNFDALLSDVMMEPMNGIDTALAVRRMCPGCRVLLVSGNQGAAEVLAAVFEDENDFSILTKPVHPAELVMRLKAECLNLAQT